MTVNSAPMYSITYHKPDGLARLTWLAGTEGMTDEDFRETLEVFAESAIQHKTQRLIIDVREFKHRPSAAILAWRDQVTVTKYNQGGAKRLAWIWPGDVSSMKPSSEGRNYEEKYLATEDEAIAWIMK